MNQRYKLDYKSPIGVIEIIGTKDAVCSVTFSERTEPLNLRTEDMPAVLTDGFNQLDEYFKGTRRQFSVPFLFEGTDFQKKVWTALTKIPYAETRSYKDIAASIGNEKAVRAVGMTNSKNKISIIVPCHRVIGANGNLTGYAGGLWRKEWLLEHERSGIHLD